MVDFGRGFDIIILALRTGRNLLRVIKKLLNRFKKIKKFLTNRKRYDRINELR